MDIWWHGPGEMFLPEWSATKEMAGHIEEGREPLIDTREGVDLRANCLYGLDYLVGIGFIGAFAEHDSIPLSHFHPRWLLDRPDVLHSR